MTYITDLKRVHHLIDEMFFDHQRALLHFEFENALSLLEIYQSTLNRHMQDEELILLPVYSVRAAFPRAGAPKFFFDDHKKMRSFVELFLEKTNDIKRQPNIDKALLLLLDREAFYLRLCAHHDKRETDFLYPTLDVVLSDLEQHDLLERISLKPKPQLSKCRYEQ